MSDFMCAVPVHQALTCPPATRPPWLAGSCLLMLGLLGAPVAQAAIQTYTIDPATGHVGGSPDKLVGTLSIDTTTGLILSQSLNWLNHFVGAPYFNQDSSAFAGNTAPNNLPGTTEMFVQSSFSSRTGFDIHLNTGSSLVGWNGDSLTLNQGFILTNCCRGAGEGFYPILDLTYLNDSPPAPVPEPAGYALLLAGGGVVALLSRRRRPR